MKTKLTQEQSQHLIELGADPKLASIVAWKSTNDWRGYNVNESKVKFALKPFRPSVMGFENFVCKDIFTLSDILTILPKEIELYSLKIEITDKSCAARYSDTQGGLLHCEYASELINALYQLLVYVIENNYYKS